eukprot:5455240-Alexandrium_andersonii.AAC.1
MATAGRATAADRTGLRVPSAPGGDRQTAAAPDTRPCGESRDPPSKVTMGPGRPVATTNGEGGATRGSPRPRGAVLTRRRTQCRHALQRSTCQSASQRSGML